MRLSSFVLNGFVLRYVQAELLGVVNLRYAIYMYPILIHVYYCLSITD